jgi:hypothetical protein
MSKARTRELLEIGNKLHSDREGLLSLWQDIAEHFYPERADFTVERALGDEFAQHLMTSVPVLARRTLGDQFGAMLRPRQKTWAKLGVMDDKLIEDDQEAKAWLEHASEKQRKFMYERQANFIRATNEGDHDFATFGQTVIEVRLRRDRYGLLYKAYHLRDCAWSENAEGAIDHMDIKRKLSVKTICELFPKTAPDRIKSLLAKEPYKEFDVRHLVYPRHEKGYALDRAFQPNAEKFPFTCYYLLCDEEAILEETPKRRLGFVIPRWKTLPGSQYALSPCTMTALPDARLMQQMALSLLEAGEKAVSPPMIATAEAVRSDIDIAAGGVTWVDSAYDERLGEVLRPITQDLEGISHGVRLIADLKQTIEQCFFLNRINLPQIGVDMTAFETQERVKEHIRAVLPLFEPMEVEYNGQICEESFQILMENGAFGNGEDMPDSLSGQEVRFNFESPLQATAERAKLEAYREAMGLVAATAQISPEAINELNINKAFRDALAGAQVPIEWMNDPKYVKQLVAHQQQMMAKQKEQAMLQQAPEMIERLGKGAAGFGAADEKFAKSGALPPGSDRMTNALGQRLLAPPQQG